ncbi:hypothetical protein SLEP1_g17203 [Rubroshorea leprosula]|uniref:Reverse transcriptase domain-containing protein n=1 Tax=Rubroshorea leprosula TaxID=152421 RepID=A0AAV5J2L0_9ROSI|nr:hypothetical protein SLEP1_g17203 [Rubroshorea leprosula]
MSYRERKPERNPNFNLVPFRAGKRPSRRDQIQPKRHPVRERPTRETQLHHNPQRSKAQGPERADREEWSRRQQHPSYDYGKGVLEKAIPFFFTNFPEDWEMGEMWRVFIKIRRVIQVFIAKKRDQKGKRFGFVRFLEVKDIRSVEYQLNQIKIGHQTLQANLARFSMHETQKKREENKAIKAKDQPYAGALGATGPQIEGHRSYVDVVRSNLGRIDNKTKPHWAWKMKKRAGAAKEEKEDWNGMEVQADEKNIRRLENCYVGRAKCPEIISTLQDKFAMEGYFSAKVTPMGGNLVLLSSGNKEELKHLVDEGREWLAQWFTDVRPWTPEEVATERFTWLRCQGVPLHIWKSNFFETVACMFGQFVSLDGSTIKKSKLDVAKILILTPLQENIKKVLKIQVKNKLFHIRIKSWSEGSNWGMIDEEESWDQWEVAKEEDEVENENNLVLAWVLESSPPEEEFENNLESTRALKYSSPEEEFENVPETLDLTENTINAGQLLSNQRRGEGLKENIMIEQWGVEPRVNGSLKQQTDGEDEGKISNEDTYPPGFGPKWRELGLITNLGPMDWTKCSHSVEQQKAMAQNQEVDKGEEKAPDGKSTQKGAYDKGNKDSTCRAKPTATGQAESNDDDSIEEERRTQPFWEGLASDNEILQSKVERLAKQRKMEKKKLKLRKVTTRRKTQLKQKSYLKGRNKKCTSEVEPQKFTIEVESRSRGGANRANTGADLNLNDDAEELWNIGKQLGLVEKNNSAEIIKKLSEMEKQDKTALAKQRLAKAEKKGGSAGGLLCIWNPKIFTMFKKMEGLGFCGMAGIWGGDRIPCFFINIYSSCNKQEKRQMWTELQGLIKDSGGGNWCLAGDFNAIRGNEERKGKWYDPGEMSEFNNFILEAGLTEISLLGRKFTWYKPDGSAMINGWSCYRLKEKFKKLKAELKKWNRDVFGDIDSNIEKAKEEIRVLDEKRETGILSETETKRRQEVFHNLWEWNNARDSLLHQKARQKWLKEGDANNKYFHSCVAQRRKFNGIEGVLINGEWVEEVKEVKKFIKEFFKENFEEDKWERPELMLDNFKKLSIEDNNSLVSCFTEKEIQEAVWGCNGSKSPGPDGFNFNFVKKMWPVLKKDICDWVAEFHNNGKLAKGSNASLIVLIPKKENPQNLGKYRPISLIGCIYKIIAKILANRLKKVMDSLIGPHQSAFIERRQITDGIIILNEMLHEAKSSKKPVLIFKADFEKAFDSVNWNFLDNMMGKFGFCHKWRLWIRECISSATVLILVNGSPTEEFQMEKGLRQRDHLAPFLFLMIAEALNGLMKKAVNENMFKGIEIGKSGLKLSHLQFADDSIFFSEATDQNVMVLKSVLRCFEMASGLKVNFFKSSLIGLNVEKNEMEIFANKLNCAIGQIPFKYLGVLVGSNPKRLSTWTLMIDTMRRRLSNWKRDTPSFGGRIILLNSVLSSISVYYFSTLKAPKQILEVKYGMDRRKVWDGSKWKGSCSTWWRNLWELDSAKGVKEGWFKEGVVKKIGEGKDMLFWHEKWVGDRSLKEKFNRLFNLSSEKDTCIADMGQWNNGEWTWTWRWRRNLFVWETNLLQELCSMLEGIKLTQGKEDNWMWKHNSKGSYTVRSAYNIINQNQESRQDAQYKLIWDNKLPLKISAFAWKALQNRISTKDNLLKRGLIEDNTEAKCILCGEKVETSTHILFSCPISWKIWCLCYDWWDIQIATQEGGWNHLKQHKGLFSSFAWVKANRLPDLSQALWYNQPKEACRIQTQ